VIGRGQPFHVITEEAWARNADLIVLGVHRRQFLRVVYVGATIERVTRTAGRHVLMANGPAGERWRKVFIATDMYTTSADAAKTAHRLGLLDGADVTFNGAS